MQESALCRDTRIDRPDYRSKTFEKASDKILLEDAENIVINLHQVKDLNTYLKTRFG